MKIFGEIYNVLRVLSGMGEKMCEQVGEQQRSASVWSCG